MKQLIIIYLLLSSLVSNSQNLIPDSPVLPIYNYYNTWAAQNYSFGRGEENGPTSAQDALNEKWLIGKEESCLDFYPKVRRDLVFVIDHGYNSRDWSIIEIDSVKFPSFGNTQVERLKNLSDTVKARGWYKLGLWLRNHEDPVPEDKIRKNLNWAKEADLGYFKIDDGDERCDYDSLRSLIYPNLVIEHIKSTYPIETVYNKGPGGSLRPEFIPKMKHLLEKAEVVRIYDIDQPLRQVTGLARIAGFLKLENTDPKAKAIINCEDIITPAAALGCSFGIFRFPITGKRPNGDPDLFNSGPQNPKKCMDEVVRAARWQRIAPPFGIGKMPVMIDTVLLSDTLTVLSGESWDKNIPQPLIQAAPARVSRGLTLPVVKAVGAAPYVVAAKNPNGAVSIATLGRFSDKNKYYVPLADVALDVGTIPSAIGIFGEYKSLTLLFSKKLTKKQVLAQDLAGDVSVDITTQVIINKKQLVIPGSLISKIGLKDGQIGDLSPPGLVIVIKEKK